jgi:hypothetical protein
MAGSTTNEVILAALNQQIQAINDLITAIGNTERYTGCYTELHAQRHTFPDY